MATAQTDPPEAVAASSGGGAGRALATVAASLGGLVAGALALAGVALILAHAVARDDAGYYSTATERLTTSTHALVSDNIDADLDGWVPAGAVGRLRVSAGAQDGRSVFVGIARRADVDAYLRGVAHDDVDDFDGSPDYVRHAGRATPTAPTREHFWVASAHGAGRQTVDWDISDGRWSVVVMNADGSRSVDVDAKAGARLDWVLPLGITLAALGTLGLVAAGAGIVAANRGRRP